MLANLTNWPPELIKNFRVLLKGGVAVKELVESFEVVWERPHGHVPAVPGTLRRIGLEKILNSRRCRERDLVVAMIVSRVLEPRSKLAAARGESTWAIQGWETFRPEYYRKFVPVQKK